MPGPHPGTSQAGGQSRLGSQAGVSLTPEGGNCPLPLLAPLPQLSQLLGRESGEEGSLLTLASLERGPLHASPTITLSCPFTFFVAFISMLASFLGIAPFWSFWCIFKAPLCQLQTGTCHGHLPSSSTRIQLCAAQLLIFSTS